MIEKVNSSCNVRTENDVANPRSKVDITIPQFRAALSVPEAEQLAEHLLQAVRVAKTLESFLSTGDAS